jgi:hypothetical protein
LVIPPGFVALDAGFVAHFVAHYIPFGFVAGFVAHRISGAALVPANGAAWSFVAGFVARSLPGSEGSVLRRVVGILAWSAVAAVRPGVRLQVRGARDSLGS